jgi:hypothetical protein
MANVSEDKKGKIFNMTTDDSSMVSELLLSTKQQVLGRHVSYQASVPLPYKSFN